MVANDDDDAVPMSGHSQESRNAAVRAVVKGLDDLGAVVFFEKALTSSDASGSGRVVIPKVGDLAAWKGRLPSGTGIDQMQMHVVLAHAAHCRSPDPLPCPVQAIAEQYFPRLEQQNGIPVRAVDTRDREYTFKYRFWVNNGVVSSPGVKPY